MVMRFLGSTANVVASSLGLFALALCVVLDAGWPTFPIVIGVYVLSAFVSWFVLPIPPAEQEPEQVRPRRAA